MKTRIMILIAALSLQGGVAARAQELALSSNIAEWLNLGTVNAGISYGFAQHWSVHALGKYNPFTWNADGAAEGVVMNKQRSLSAGVRFWPWHIYSGLWIENRAQWQEYSVSPYKKEYAEEGDRIGDVISAGYSYMLSRHLNLDFGLGFWMGYGTVTRYACPRCGRIQSSGDDCFARLSEMVLSLSYVF